MGRRTSRERIGRKGSKSEWVENSRPEKWKGRELKERRKEREVRGE